MAKISNNFMALINQNATSNMASPPVKSSYPKKIKINLNKKIQEIKERNILTESEILHNKFLDRHENEMLYNIDEIDFLITNLIKREDIKIDYEYNTYNEYNTYILKKEHNQSNNYYHISIKISPDYINVYCEFNKGIDSYYESMEFKNKTLFIKWNTELENKYFKNLKSKSKKLFDNIADITKISRKKIINKLIEENKKED